MNIRMAQFTTTSCGQPTLTWPVWLRQRLTFRGVPQHPVQARVPQYQVAAVPTYSEASLANRNGYRQLEQHQLLGAQHQGDSWCEPSWQSAQQDPGQMVQQAGLPVLTAAQQEQPQLQHTQQQQQGPEYEDQQQDDPEFQIPSAAAAAVLPQPRQQSLQDSLQQHPEPWMVQLQQCQHWSQIATLVDSWQHQLTYQQVYAALGQLLECVQQRTPSQLQRQQLDNLLAKLAYAAAQHLPSLHHQDVGLLLARLQVLGFKPSVAWLKPVLQHAGTELIHYTPAELALLLLVGTQTVARAAGKSAPLSATVRLQAIRPVSIATSNTALIVTAQLDEPSSSYSVSVAGSASSSRDSGDSSSTASRRANTVLTTAWLQHFMATFQHYLACRTPHPQLQSQHLEAVITCLAALRVVPDRFWLYLFVRQLSAQLPACPPGSVVRILSALASIGYRLPEHLVTQIERQVGGAALALLRPQECVEVVKSVAALKHKPSDAWMRQLLAAIIKGSIHLNASAVVAVLVGTAALGVNMDHGWVNCLLLQVRAALHMLSAPEHVGLIDALSQQQHRPGPVFMSVYMSQVQAHLPDLTIGQQAVLLSGLAAVGYKPAPAWMTAFMGQLAGQRVSSSDAAAVLKLLNALRRMQYVPTSHMAQQLEGLIGSSAVGLSYQELQQLRNALLDLQYRPQVAASAVRISGWPRPATVVSACIDAPTEEESFRTIHLLTPEQQRQQQQQQLLQQQQECAGQSSDAVLQDVSTQPPTSSQEKPSVIESLELFA